MGVRTFTFWSRRTDLPLYKYTKSEILLGPSLYRPKLRHWLFVLRQFIVPQPPRLTLKDVVTELEREYSSRVNPPVNYIFSNNYFFTDFPAAPPLTTVPPGPGGAGTSTAAGQDELAWRLMTLRFRRRSPLSVYGYAVKSIIDPLACERMHNHYCWAVTRDFASRGYIEVVSDKVAVNQHYKSCHLNVTECADALKRSTIDDATMKPHRDKLVANVVQRIRDIFGLSPSEFLQRFPRT